MLVLRYTYTPNEEFELTANSLGAHIETHSGLILRTLSYLTMNSQDDSHCEIAVSYWIIPLRPPYSGGRELTV